MGREGEPQYYLDKTTFVNTEKERYKKITLDMIKRRFREFRKNEKIHSKVLFVGDFVPMSGRRHNSGTNELQFLLPGDIFIPAYYSELYSGFMHLLSNRIISEPDYGSVREILDSQVKSSRLDAFRTQNSGLRLNVNYTLISLDAPVYETQQAQIRRFIDPVTLEPLAEAWDVTRFIAKPDVDRLFIL